MFFHSDGFLCILRFASSDLQVFRGDLVFVGCLAGPACRDNLQTSEDKLGGMTLNQLAVPVCRKPCELVSILGLSRYH